MKITCLSGYYVFEESMPGEISDFINYTRLDLVRRENYFTFKNLLDAPEFSISSMPLLNLIANITCEGKPWDVFKANGFSYDFTTGKIVNSNLVIKKFTIKGSGNMMVSPGLILPGSINQDGQKIESYVCWYDRSGGSWYYTEVTYV